MTQHLEFSVTDGIAKILLNRPERRNAFTFEMIDAWAAAFQKCRTDDNVRVVMVTGSGAAFCSGGDVVEMGDRLNYQYVIKLIDEARRAGFERVSPVLLTQK